MIAANSFFTETIKRKKEPEKLKKLMTKVTYSLCCSFWVQQTRYVFKIVCRDFFSLSNKTSFSMMQVNFLKQDIILVPVNRTVHWTLGV